MTLKEAKKEATRQSEKDTNNYFHVTKAGDGQNFDTWWVSRYFSSDARFWASKGRIHEHIYKVFIGD
jgi:hypothetical protein|tara:strand:- start:511 stop:711 length:201 start_codon:yes stop_codon:yes gene_type:complete